MPRNSNLKFNLKLDPNWAQISSKFKTIWIRTQEFSKPMPSGREQNLWNFDTKFVSKLGPELTQIDFEVQARN